MMNNIVINAIKSLEEIENPKISVKCEHKDRLISIRISDNGKSIDSESIDEIFNYGYSTTGGSGIGLFHAKYLCELFEGKIEVEVEQESIYTKCFLITLPIEELENQNPLS